MANPGEMHDGGTVG